MGCYSIITDLTLLLSTPEIQKFEIWEQKKHKMRAFFSAIIETVLVFESFEYLSLSYASFVEFYATVRKGFTILPAIFMTNQNQNMVSIRRMMLELFCTYLRREIGLSFDSKEKCYVAN